MRLRLFYLLLLAVLLPSCALALNQKETVEKVTGNVSLTADVDYIVTSATPFADGAVVDIANTDHAVLILQSVKPSEGIKLLQAHVTIDGQRAQNNTNCQVKMYNRGCIVLPYPSSFKPLTVYSEPDFGGDSSNSFGLESDGGLMNTMTDRQLNNRVRSFKLKRGYMVTFSLRARGRGYSRCFIAADRDLEVATLPTLLDQTISSYRIFRWQDAGKTALAAASGDTKACSALNVTSTYTWGTGSSMLPDVESVAHQIYSGYPSAASCGGANWTAHLKTSNEPRNGNDDHPEDLAAILANWESLMATGMRLCSPSSWDGSDYWDGTGFLKQFFDSIDARGWRCDILDMHCYWAESNFPNLRNWLNAVHRPIWISEWCWGASWNNNGAFASGVTENQVRDALQRICNTLNGYDYVERYFYWNGERDPSRIYNGGGLTPAGEMYSKLDGGVGYNGKYDYVPATPRQGSPSNLVISYDKNTLEARLTWHEPNGEMNRSHVVQRRIADTKAWEDVYSVPMQEEPADYDFTDTGVPTGCQYRVVTVDANGATHQTPLVMAASDNLQAGDAVVVDGATKYLGGNVIGNGDFALGAYGWTDGTGQTVSQPWFQVVAEGGYEGGAYLQCYGNGSATEAASLKTVFDVEPQSDYYFTGAVCNTTGIFAQLTLTDDGVTPTTVKGYLNNTTANWLTQFFTFNTDASSKALIAFAYLGGTAQFDKLGLYRLCDSREEAIADGVKQALSQLQAIGDCVATFREWADSLQQQATAADEATLQWLQENIAAAQQACRLQPRLGSLLARFTEMLASYRFYGQDEIEVAVDDAMSEFGKKCGYTPQWVIDTYASLDALMARTLPLTSIKDKVKSATFDGTSDGWTVKAGTYQGGDQRLNSKDGVTFWNAWWSGLSSTVGDSQTMAITQQVDELDHGLYCIECKASTEHYCLTDQHAFITDGQTTRRSPSLTADFYDLASVADSLRWQTLCSTPVYVDDGASLTIGFQGSKLGAVDNAWRRVGEPTNKGDKREGWWCATDFVLRFHPLYRTTVEPGQWGVICLPYAVRPDSGTKFYRLAGITPDCQQLCLREIGESEAGVPFIYRSEQAEVSFLEHGEAVTATTDGSCNLRGFLKTTAKVPRGYYYLTEGRWVKVGDDRPDMSNYTGVIRPFNDRYSKPVPVIHDWTGLTMPIVGVTDEEIAAGISQPAAPAAAGRGQAYDLQGRKMKAASQRGVAIVKGKKMIKK